MSYNRNEEALIAFGKRVRQLRLEKKMTQEDLAHAAGIAHSQLVKIENGQINTGLSNVFAVAKGLGVKPSQLFNF